ncbi:hypothetical protein CI109_104655 [Kwoniella shandongensis]|uniref:Uncharacterized protein n=1 Tax=Kwoniella shandongensis TaxID=1734106 RepID=A0A5M6BWY6_9TREE|nr:uncharacterized protein CI109_004821 [Kwoniella shandongensis]KAA5526821.1 hypothetical protein CI109_004821 [Kwoniella shandongensis]
MTTPTVDPLDLLRQSILSSNLPTLLTASSDPLPSLSLGEAAYLSFPSDSDGGEPINLPKDTPTRYTSNDGFYNIASLWLAWKERETGVRDYLIKGQATGVGYVTITDRRGVVEYLTGESDGAGRVVGKGTKEEGGSAAQATSAASATVESLPSALESATATTTEAGPSRPAAAPKRKYEVDVVDREFCKKLRAEEIELRDRNTVLRSSGGGKVNNFESFLKSVMQEKIRTLRSSFDKGGKSAAPVQSQAGPLRAKKARSTNPIIIISSSPTSLLTMWNVKKFLEQGVFEPSEVARQNEAAQGNVRAEDMVPVIRKRSGPHGDVTSKYYIVDGVDALQKFGQDAWDRVICVVTTGQAWQFKPYKWQDPRVLFRNVKGIYFQWNNEPVNPTVKDWNVTEMRIDRNKRHTDRQVVADFWRILDGVKRR